MALAALAGAAVSGYLVWARSTGAELLCTTGGCETVQSSSYAEVPGRAPRARRLRPDRRHGAPILARGSCSGAALALTAVVFSGYLLVVQVAVIDALCAWCVANDAIAVVVSSAALLRVRENLRPPSRQSDPGSSSPSASA